MRNLFFLLCLIAPLLGVAQPLNGCFYGRYYSPVFSQVKTTKNILYGENVLPTFADPNNRQKLYLDVYEPQGDVEATRPLLVLAFGGAFVAGSRTSADIVELANRFTKLGYVVAAIDYRLTGELIISGTPANAMKAVTRGMHDMKASVRFFRKDFATTNSYRIDTSRIFVGGVSAGAIAALHAAYLNTAADMTVLPLDTLGIGGVEGLSGNPGYSSSVAGVVNLCGALGSLQYMSAGEVPLVSVHGDADDVVPYGADTLTLFNINMPLWGSAAIHPHATALGIPNSFKSFAGAGHTPFISNPAYMDTTFWVSRDFLFSILCPGVVASVEAQDWQPTNLAPSPMTDEATLTFSQTLPLSATLRVFDAAGREISLATETSGKSIRIIRGALPAGIYFWQLNSEVGVLSSGKLPVW